MKNICDKIYNASRISYDEAMNLYSNADLLTLGHLADTVKNRLHPDLIISFVVDRNINYTNVCKSKCLFCAFYRNHDSFEAYIISKNDLKKKIEGTIQIGGTQILLQGGMHPELDINYYVDLLKYIKDNFDIHIHGFSPPEIDWISEKSSLTLKDTISILKEAGLNSIPGGGAEILADDIRRQISPNKSNSDTWLEVMRTAHNLGLHSTATMMFGHVEKKEHIINHLIKIRGLQDETGGFTAFIPWSFQPQNTKINILAKTPATYLRVLAISRIVLDNFKNIQASWVTQGEKIAQIALNFGANDFGSTMLEENVVAAAGVRFRMSKQEIIRLIKDAGFKAVQRDCFYKKIKEF